MAGDNGDWVQSPRLWVLSGVVLLFVAAAHFLQLVGDLTHWGVDSWQFLLGALVTLQVGHGAAIAVLSRFRETPSKPEARRRAMWVGYLERGVFTFFVTMSVPWSVAGALAWATLKFSANWGPRVAGNGKETRVKAMSAAVATLVSLAVAVGGGLIIRGSVR